MDNRILALSENYQNVAARRQEIQERISNLSVKDTDSSTVSSTSGKSDSKLDFATILTEAMQSSSDVSDISSLIGYSSVASVVSALAGGQASSYTYLTPMLSLFNGISEYLNSSSSDISTTSDTSASLSDDSLKNESSAAASGTSSNTGVTTSGTLESIFAKAAQTYGISENLLKAVAKAESDFDTNAVSSAGAQGIMQLMPATAKALGVTNAFDPEQNIMGGAKYLSQMLERYNGDTTLALAAYNAGPGNVKKYGGVPPFKSTQSYIKKVLSYAGEI